MSSTQVFFSSAAFKDRLASLTSNGVNGHNGLPGRDGRDGAKRENCVVGPPGPRRERNGTKRNSHLSQKLETVRVEEQRRSWHVLKIRRPVYKRLFKSRAMCYQKGDVNQTCQTVSRFWPIGACVRIWVHSGCRGIAVPKVCLQSLPLSIPRRFFNPFPN